MSGRSWAVCALAVVAAALLPAGVAAAGGFCAGYEGERVTDAEGTDVVMAENCFSPTVLRVNEGDTVTFTNEDPEAHTVGGAAGSFGDMHRELSSGRSVSYRFDEGGVFPYVCLVHPGMAGAIVVGDGVASAGAAGAAPAASEVAPRSDTRPEGSEERSSGSSTVPRALSLVAVAVVLGAVARLAVHALRREATGQRSA
jgi:plastocyanin